METKNKYLINIGFFYVFSKLLFLKIQVCYIEKDSNPQQKGVLMKYLISFLFLISISAMELQQVVVDHPTITINEIHQA